MGDVHTVTHRRDTPKRKPKRKPEPEQESAEQ